MKNKYSGYCYRCGEAVEVGEGVAEQTNGNWNVRCAKPCSPMDSTKVEKKEVARDSAEHDAGSEGDQYENNH